MKNPKIILASSSPRRQELLALTGYEFDVIVSNIDENIEGTVEYRVEELARRKATAVKSTLTQNAIIIGADTLVSIDGKVIEKPIDNEHAYKMLKTLQDRSHYVYTGVAIIEDEQTHSFVESTKVFFRQMSDSEIWKYIETGEPFDKAGGYGIQGLGALFVERIEGDYYSVMGLPVSKLYEKLTKKALIP